MSATEVIEQIDQLPVKEQQEVFIYLTRKVVFGQAPTPKPWLGRKLSFEEACDVVFRENRQLLSALAK